MPGALPPIVKKIPPPVGVPRVASPVGADVTLRCVASLDGGPDGEPIMLVAPLRYRQRAVLGFVGPGAA